MGTALVLLFLLALGAVPGALLPQRSLNAPRSTQYIAEHPVIGPWLDRLQFFDVFSSFWFTAIYVLLFISLVGCLTPRMIEHARSLRAIPVPAPRNLARLPKHAEAPSGTGDPRGRSPRRWPSGCAAGARSFERTSDGVTPPRCPPRRAICASSATWSSTSRCSACWSRWPPARCSATRATSSSSPTAAPVSARHRRRRSTRSAPATPSTAPRCTRCACGSTTSRPSTCPAGRPDRSPPTSTTRPATTSHSDTWRPYRLEVNHPLRVGGDRVYLQGHGYAPTFTVTFPDGQTRTQTVQWRPEDPLTLLSSGVVRIDPPGGHLPRRRRTPQTADRDPGPVRADRTTRRHAAVVELPGAERPRRGHRHLPRRHRAGHRPAAVAVHPGSAADRPGPPDQARPGEPAGRGAGPPRRRHAVRFDGATPFVNLQVSHDPGSCGCWCSR